MRPVRAWGGPWQGIATLRRNVSDKSPAIEQTGDKGEADDRERYPKIARSGSQYRRGERGDPLEGTRIAGNINQGLLRLPDESGIENLSALSGTSTTVTSCPS